MRKPTGDPDIPDYVKKAKETERRILDKTHTFDIDDSDPDLEWEEEVREPDSDSSIKSEARMNPVSSKTLTKEPSPTISTFKHTHKSSTPSASTDWSSRPGTRKNTPATEIMKKTSVLFDPEVQAQREDSRALQTFMLSQHQSFERQIQAKERHIEELNRQLREAEKAKERHIEELNHQLREAEKARDKAELASDQLQTELHFTRMMAGASSQPQPMFRQPPMNPGYYDDETKFVVIN